MNALTFMHALSISVYRDNNYLCKSWPPIQWLLCSCDPQRDEL